MLYLTVYCSSSDHIDTKFFKLTEQLIHALVNESFGIVYGGGSQGLMGHVAKTTIESGGSLIGVIPETLIDTEIPFPNATEMIYTPSLRERKGILSEKGDAILVLPGGLGTLDELFEVLTLKSIGVFQKPIIIFNMDNFFTPLERFLYDMRDMTFIKRDIPSLLTICKTDKDVIHTLITYFQ